MSLGLSLLCGLALGANAGTTTSEMQVLGQVGAGEEVPEARFEVRLATADAYALKVSSPDGTAMAVVDRAGRLGIGISAPAAALDVRGSADDGTIALQLRVGNSTAALDAAQITFACNSSQTFRHAIRTQADTSLYSGNQMLFYLWRSTGQPNAIGAEKTLALQGVSASTPAAVHVRPFGDPDAELEVSNGSSTGGGSIHRAAAATHSSAGLKSDIERLPREEEERAYEDVASLRHVRFRYARDTIETPIRRGLVFEEAPDSIQGGGDTIVVDYRVLNLALALKAADRRIRALSEEVARLESLRAQPAANGPGEPQWE